MPRYRWQLLSPACGLHQALRSNLRPGTPCDALDRQSAKRHPDDFAQREPAIRVGHELARRRRSMRFALPPRGMQG